MIKGPGVYICDVCVDNCNEILDATPTGFAKWESLTDEQLLDSLKYADATVEVVRDVLQARVEILRKRGVSWATIGNALGISRQAAWERFL